MNQKILIVEDEKDVVRLLRMILTDRGYQCFDVPTGEKVFDFLDNQTVDVILLDIILPGMNGYEVCRRLKTHRQTNMIPVIMLTAKAFHEDVVHGLSVGADKYITKPFEQNNLLTEIEKQVQKKKELRESGILGEIEFHIQSDLKYLEQLNEMTTLLFKYTPLTEKDITDIHFVLLELGKNAIEWGNKNQKELPVHIQYITDREKFTIHIRDHGSGFNFQRYLDSTYCLAGEYKIREKEKKRSGGLGIMLARVYMDEIQYNEKGNEVTLIKCFTEPAKPS
jgi:DNA-binding response OmpR family regulator